MQAYVDSAIDAAKAVLKCNVSVQRLCTDRVQGDEGGLRGAAFEEILFCSLLFAAIFCGLLVQQTRR